MRIGVFSGMFNPPHIGHLNAAEQAFKLLRLDKMYIVPADYPCYENQLDITDKEDRYRMCKAFMDCGIKITISRLEIDGDEPLYTSDTISAIKEYYKEYPDDEYFLLIGAHEFRYDLINWHNVKYLIDNVTFAVLPRTSSSEIADYQGGVYELEHKFNKTVNAVFVNISNTIINTSEANSATVNELSSTLIRERVQEGRKFKHLLPTSVASYIVKHNLYGYRGEENELRSSKSER